MSSSCCPESELCVYQCAYESRSRDEKLAIHYTPSGTQVLRDPFTDGSRPTSIAAHVRTSQLPRPSRLRVRHPAGAASIQFASKIAAHTATEPRLIHRPEEPNQRLPDRSYRPCRPSLMLLPRLGPSRVCPSRMRPRVWRWRSLDEPAFGSYRERSSRRSCRGRSSRRSYRE